MYKDSNGTQQQSFGNYLREINEAVRVVVNAVDKIKDNVN
jgi:hypothetical protein